MTITITEPLLISWHLGLNPITLPKGHILYSTFAAPLKEVRMLSKRDESTGIHLSNNSSPSWMAAKGYLALIEQLGNAYNIDPSESEPNNFKRSLKMFSQLNTDQIEILWGLRCSLFHDFAIVRNDGKPNYIFNVGPGGIATKFISAAPKNWNGAVPVDGNLVPFICSSN